jgi:hypothetical protein
MELTPGTYVEKHEVFIIGTGNPVTGTKSHVGSFVQSSFVWHGASANRRGAFSRVRLSALLDVKALRIVSY